MKFKLLSILSLLLSLTVFAAPVSQTDLDKVNKYIEQLIKKDDPNDVYSFQITSAEKEPNGQLSAVNVKAEFDEEIEFEGGITLEGETIDIGLLLSGNFKKEMDTEQLLQIIQMVQVYGNEYIKAINKQGFYKATLNISTSQDKASAEFKMIPVHDEAVSINLLEFSVEVDLKTKDVTGIMSSDLNATSELVEKGQVALTKIFNTLLKGEEPKEEDLDKLHEVLEEVFKSLQSEEMEM